MFKDTQNSEDSQFVIYEVCVKFILLFKVNSWGMAKNRIHLGID